MNGFTDTMPPELISKVWPSGGDLATASPPRLPPEPLRFSTTMGWPRASCSAGLSARANWSAAPPGGKLTMTLTGFWGQGAWAPAPGPSSASSTKANQPRRAGHGRGEKRCPEDVMGSPVSGSGRRLRRARCGSIQPDVVGLDQLAPPLALGGRVAAHVLRRAGQRLQRQGLETRLHGGGVQGLLERP